MIFDIVVIIILLISAGIAFLRGFIREVLTIFGVIGGLAAAFFIGPSVMPLTRNMLGVDENAEEPERFMDIVPYDIIADMLAYGIVFIIVVIALSVLSHFLSKRVKAIGLGSVDRSLGVVFGLIRGLLILAVLYLPIYVFVDDEARDNWFGGSRSEFYIEKTSAFLASFVPDNYISDAKKMAQEETENKSRSTREKLEEMDLIGGKKSVNQDTKDQSGEGYENKERQNLNELIEENLDE